MNQEWITDFWNRIESKLAIVAPQVETPFPYTTDTHGKFVAFRDETWWTNGFWAGIMWLAFKETGNKCYKDIAIASEEALDRAFLSFDGLHHDVGFMWLPSAVEHYRIDGNEKSKSRGMHAATLLAGRFNCMGEFIRAWNRDHLGWVIIDSMMNIPLLHWAYKETGDPRFYHIAVKHADTVMRNFVREDGSVHHIVELDPQTGEVISIPIGQGYASGSSWSRGQAWAIYGFALSYQHTGDLKYLEVAKRVADYFIEHLSEDGVPVVDFKAPVKPVMKDTAAAAVAASGMIELMTLVEENEKERYEAQVEKLLKGLKKNCDFELDKQSVLQNGTERYHGTTGIHIPIIYGDYYLIEALLKIKNMERGKKK